MSVPVPEELVDLARERRIIPFVGAGFSAGVGLPSWEELLGKLVEQTEGAPPLQEILAQTGGDLLQAAEYLFLLCDRRIGPIRHALERGLVTSVDPASSGPHVELANLGQPQVYTTNYDDLIEDAYRHLGLPVTTVVLPKDVALADTDRTQVVKYHGDLRHENTLVLTESAYYRRLDFESPMDLKFRSDLLGRSVLFMGYSFRDLNIRVIWFKLMQMMKDIPESDRRPSYIVRLEDAPVLDALYESVGLKPIKLSGSRVPLPPEERTRLLGEFLMRLADKASKDSRQANLHVSKSAIALLHRQIDRLDDEIPEGIERNYALHAMVDGQTLDRIVKRKVPSALYDDLRRLLKKMRDNNLLGPALIVEWMPLVRQLGLTADVGPIVLRALMAQGGSSSLRKSILDCEVDWPAVWSSKPTEDDLRGWIHILIEEYLWHVNDGGVDEDILYSADMIKRAVMGHFESLKDSEILKTADAMLGLVTELYPALQDYEPSRERAPHVAGMALDRSVLEKLSEAEDARKRMEAAVGSEFLQASRFSRITQSGAIRLSRGQYWVGNLSSVAAESALNLSNVDE
jgi:hypothetical protein